MSCRDDCPYRNEAHHVEPVTHRLDHLQLPHVERRTIEEASNVSIEQEKAICKTVRLSVETEGVGKQRTVGP